MYRLAPLALILLSSSALWAQPVTSGQVTVSTVPPVGRFAVDGTKYMGAASFVWPAGSKHILQFFTDNGSGSIQTSTDQSTQYAFGGWVDNAGLLALGGDPVQTITADPRITSFTATLSVSYKVSLNFFTPPDNLSPNCRGVGSIP